MVVYRVQTNKNALVTLPGLQRWAKDYLRRRLDWVMEDMYGRQEYASNSNPRHIRSALCPCQVKSSLDPFRQLEIELLIFELKHFRITIRGSKWWLKQEGYL